MAKNKKGKDKSPVAEPERKANETENEQIPEVVDLDSEVANSSLKCSNEEDLLAAKAEILELRALLLAKDKELMELKGLRSAAQPASSEDIQKLQVSSIQFALTYKKIYCLPYACMGIIPTWLCRYVVMYCILGTSV